MRKSYSELESENMFLRQILDDISDGVYAAGSDGTIIVYNKAVEEIDPGTKTDKKQTLNLFYA